MLIKMQKQYFDSLPTETLGHACFEPMVPVYQNAVRQLKGKELLAFKASFYKSLLQGQQALFLFFVYYDHAIESPFGFYQTSSFYLASSTFAAVKKGVAYFRDEGMHRLLSEVEDALSAAGEHRLSASELERMEAEKGFYASFQKIAPDTIALIGECMRQNPAEFICLEE